MPIGESAITALLRSTTRRCANAYEYDIPALRSRNEAGAHQEIVEPPFRQCYECQYDTG